MKEKISELMDGELERRAAAGPLDALKGEGEARDTWRKYHFIGDVMRDTRMLSSGFAARVAAKLAEEPTVMAPARLLWRTERPRWQLLSAAASLAAVAFVGWVAFSPQESEPQLAQVQPQTQSIAAQVAPPARVGRAAQPVRPARAAQADRPARAGRAAPPVPRAQAVKADPRARPAQAVKAAPPDQAVKAAPRAHRELQARAVRAARPATRQ